MKGSNPLPGVAAVVTDRNGNIYEGADGSQRIDDPDKHMKTDTVFAIYSGSKIITSVAVLQLVENGLLDLDAPAKKYLAELGDFQVLEGFDSNNKPIL